MVGLEHSVQLDDIIVIHSAKQGDLMIQTAFPFLLLCKIRLEDYLGCKDLLILYSAYLVDTCSAAFSDLAHHLVDMLKPYLIYQLS